MIWRATDHEQELWYELATFKHWLSQTRSASFSCTFEGLTLRNINRIALGIIFHSWLSLSRPIHSLNNETLTADNFIQSLVQQIISTVEQLVQHYQHQIINEKEKLLSHLETT